jgi:hypothetical protein
MKLYNSDSHTKRRYYNPDHKGHRFLWLHCIVDLKYSCVTNVAQEFNKRKKYCASSLQTITDRAYQTPVLYISSVF